MIEYTTREFKDYAFSKPFELSGKAVLDLKMDGAVRENHILTDNAFAARMEDIRVNGQQTPIDCIKGAKGELYVLDGRHRTRIAIELGIPLMIQIIEEKLSTRQKIDFVIRRHKGYRQESEGHRAILAARRVVKSDAELKAISDLPDMSRRKRDSLKIDIRYTAKDAAVDAGTSPDMINTAKSIIRRGGELYELLVLDKNYSLSKVSKMISKAKKNNSRKTGQLKPEYEREMEGRDEEFREHFHRVIDESRHTIPAHMATRFVLDYIGFDAQNRNFDVLREKYDELSAEVSVLRAFADDVGE